MSGLLVSALICRDVLGHGHAADDPFFGKAHTPTTLLIDGARFGPALANFLFAFIVQQSLPTLARRAAHPPSVRPALIAALGTCGVLYVLLGGSAALYFGNGTQKLVTLNFAGLRGVSSKSAPPALWARLVSRWVLWLPNVTTTAAFPLFNRVLAANLEALLPPNLRSRRAAAALCAAPPLLLTACVRDVALVFALCGLAGFTIVWFVPAALQRAAMAASVRRWGEAGRATPHTTRLSGPVTVALVTATGMAAFVYNVYAVVVAQLASPSEE